LSDDQFDRTWGVTDSAASEGEQSLWVAAGGADALDPTLGSYPANLNSWLVTELSFDLSEVQMADVEFFMRMETESSADTIFVGASVDGENYSGELWSGNSGGWQHYRLDLGEFLGYKTVYLAWLFESDENNEGNSGGLWLDDMTFWTYVDSGPVKGQELVQNGDFETGDLSGWSYASKSTVMVKELPNPLIGQYVAFLGGIPNAQEIFYQPITIPAAGDDAPSRDDMTSAQLGFWINQQSEETTLGADLFCAALYDEERANILVDLGCLDGLEAIDKEFNEDGWWQVDEVLSSKDWDAIQGQTVNLVFEMSSNSELATALFLDDITFEYFTGGSAGDQQEPNDYFERASEATLGVEMSQLTIDPAYDQDFFHFTGQTDDQVTINIDADVNGSALDSYVSLQDANGHLVCENDDDEVSLDSFLICTLPSSGDYYAVVISYDYSGNRNYVYSIQIDLTSAIEPTPTPQPTPTPTPTPTPEPDMDAWTAILYIDGDNNLCDNYPPLFTRMERVLEDKIDENGFLNVVVLFDQDAQYCEGEDGTMRFVVQPDGAYSDGVNRWQMGELNMGDPQTLINFADWAISNYPAEHYYLAIDNHGAGISGIAWDSSNQNDNLTNDELYSALKQITNNANRRLDLLAFEACLMNLYENVYDLRNLADYVFGFESISFTNRASYPSYFRDSRFNEDTTAQQLGDIVYDVYLRSVTSPYTLSLIDSSGITALHSAINDFANALQPEVATSKELLMAGRNKAQKFEQNNDRAINNADGFIDLWDLADKVAAQGLATTEAAALKEAIDEAVLRSGYRPPTTRLGLRQRQSACICVICVPFLFLGLGIKGPSI
jgi:hypothetical protein